MNFNVQIIQHAEAAVTVSVSDPVSGGLQPVTYSALRRSLGTQVYSVNVLYLYSENVNQLTGAINYNVFDASGNQNVTNLVTAIDPYQYSNSLYIDINKTNVPIVFNGNSSLSATILPNTSVQVKFFATRLTNSFGKILMQFKEMQEISGRSDFFENYGVPIEQIYEAEQRMLNSIGGGNVNETEQQTKKQYVVKSSSSSERKTDFAPLLIVSALSLIGYFWINKSRK